VVIGIVVARCIGDVLRLGASLLARYDLDVLIDGVLLPLADQGFLRRLRHDNGVRVLVDDSQALHHVGERRHAVDHVRDTGVHCQRPFQGRGQLRVVRLLDDLGERLVRQRLARSNELPDLVPLRDLRVAGLHLGPLLQQVKDLDQGGPPVGAAPLRVQVHELARLAGVLADGLQPPVLDDVRGEAFLVLDLPSLSMQTRWSCCFSS